MSKGRKAKLRQSATAASQAAPIVKLNMPPPWTRITDVTVAKSLRKQGLIPVAFEMPAVPPRVIPKDVPQAEILANDELIIEANAWAAQQVYNGAFINGVTFLGYTYLSELAQRPEYRRVSEVLATEATRKWIKIQSVADGDESKLSRIADLSAEMDRLDVQGAFRKMVELDGFFGRAHLYLDTGSTDDRDELTKPIGDGRDDTTLSKFKGKTGFLKALKPVEPVWCYPAFYNADDPLKPDWYNPQQWFCQGKQIHSSRLLSFVGREVPDLLKPSYSFGGLSLSQMAKPYIDNWLRTRQAVADLVWSFSVRGLKTNLAAALAGDGDQLFSRASLFANLQTNQGMMVLDKDTEDFFNIATPLGSLDALQAQSQEHICSVVGIPVVKLLGIQPAGLNASSEGELTVWYDWVEAFQEKFIRRRLIQVMNFIMLSLWGEIDPDIVFSFESLRALDEKELAEKRKIEAETDQILIETGAIEPMDARQRIAADPDSPYDGLDVGEDPGVEGAEPEVEPAEDEPALAEVASRIERQERDMGRQVSRRGARQRDRDEERRPAETDA